MAESLPYLDFEIEIGIGNGLSYPVTARSQAGDIHTIMLFPFDQVVLGNRLLALQNALLRSGRPSRDHVSPEEKQSESLARPPILPCSVARSGSCTLSCRRD
ncbi:MAG: hypothetical protein NVSMB52_17070 [Chloroflexota bacterium]